jgi:phage-related protein
MPRQTFTWYPDEGSTNEIKPQVEPTRFGDGYEQRVQKGINSMPEKWSLKFTNNMIGITEITTFLKNHGGLLAFNWTTPMQDSGVYVCRSWNLTKVNPNVVELMAEFEQVFEA